jgi:hypothetical protein
MLERFDRQATGGSVFDRGRQRLRHIELTVETARDSARNRLSNSVGGSHRRHVITAT